MALKIDEHSSITPFPIALALFDIDGTLLDKSGHFSDALVNELKRIRKLGVKTAIASGRPHFAARFLVQQLGLEDVGVFCTGAHIYNPKTHETMQAFQIESSAARDFVLMLRNSNVYYELYSVDHFYYEGECAPQIRIDHAKQLRAEPVQRDLLEMCDHAPVLKFLVGAQGEAGFAQLKQLEQAFPQFVFAYAKFPMYPDWFFASVISASGCKEQAFQWLLDYYQIQSDQVASFGDSQSDMTFLKLAGHGVAMGNAADDVKQVARWETRSSCNDGVAYALKRLI